MKEILNFTANFKSNISLDEKFLVKKKNRYFLLNKKLKSHLRNDFYYAGIYLGKIKGRRFFPSFNLLAMMARGKANKIMINKKTEWLFICGRDIFKRGILEISKPIRKGTYTLLMNQHEECLGFGKLLCDLENEKDPNKVAVRNISDLGDFLRRER